MRSHLALQQQFDTLAADLRCLTEALDDRPPPPPRWGPLEAAPLPMAARSDCAWPNPAYPADKHSQAGLGAADVLELEERTFKLLDALGDQKPTWSGPLTDMMLDSARPPPYRSRGDKYGNRVKVYSNSEPSADGRGTALMSMPPLDDTDLQPVPGSRQSDGTWQTQTAHAAPPSTTVTPAASAAPAVPVKYDDLPNYDDLQRRARDREAARR